MARTRYSLGTHPLLPDPLGGDDKLDLSVGRTLEHAIRRLDGIASRRPHAYPDAWMEEAIDIAILVTASCDRAGEWLLFFGSAIDGQEAERDRRRDALVAHLHAVDGAYGKVLDIVRRMGRFTDDRDISAREVVSLLRPFLATGGRLLIRPDGRPEVCPDIKLLFWNYHDPETIARSDSHMAATREIKDIPNRWRSHRPLRRIARMLGNRLENGWLEFPEHRTIVRQSVELVAC